MQENCPELNPRGRKMLQPPRGRRLREQGGPSGKWVEERPVRGSARASGGLCLQSLRSDGAQTHSPPTPGPRPPGRRAHGPAPGRLKGLRLSHPRTSSRQHAQPPLELPSPPPAQPRPQAAPCRQHLEESAWAPPFSSRPLMHPHPTPLTLSLSPPGSPRPLAQVPLRRCSLEAPSAGLPTPPRPGQRPRDRLCCVSPAPAATAGALPGSPVYTRAPRRWPVCHLPHLCSAWGCTGTPRPGLLQEEPAAQLPGSGQQHPPPPEAQDGAPEATPPPVPQPLAQGHKGGTPMPTSTSGSASLGV